MTKQDLRKAGLKVTLPRLKILQILEDAPQKHMGAEEIYKALVESKEDVGLATVYRVLAQFEQAGILTRHNFESDHALYELNQGEHHDHLVCIRCGRVDEFIDAAIEARQKNIAEQAGFIMTDHSLNIYGVCVQCQ